MSETRERECKLRNENANSGPDGENERLWHQANEPLANAEQ